MTSTSRPRCGTGRRWTAQFGAALVLVAVAGPAAVAHADSASTGLIVFRGSNGLELMNGDGSNVVTVPTPSGVQIYGDPQLSPDGSTIVFVGIANDVSGIFTMGTNGANLSELVSDSGNVNPNSPAWSADGTMIAWSDGRSIYTMTASGGDLTQLTDPAGNDDDFSPSWSPDGQHLAYISDHDRIAYHCSPDEVGFYDQVYEIDAAGTNPTRMSFGSDDDQWKYLSVDWHGSQLALTREQVSSTDDNCAVVQQPDVDVAPAAGGSIVDISQTPNDDELGASWSPDGAQIATEVGFTIYSLPAAGGSRVALNSLGEQPSWQEGTAAPAPTPAQVTGSPTPATAGAMYSYAFGLKGIPAPTVTLSSGALPAGLSLSASGVLSGTADIAGTYDFTVSASNGVGSAATDPVTLTVNPGAPTDLQITAGDGQSAVSGHTFASPLTATVLDAWGNVVPGASVTFAVIAGSAQFNGSATVTSGADGSVTAPPLVAGSTAGAVVVTAAGSTITNGAVYSLSVAANLVARADLSISLSGQASGNTITGTFTATNKGPASATGAIMEVSVPAGFTVVSAPGSIRNGAVLGWVLPSPLTAKHSKSYAVKVTVASSVHGLVVLSAGVSSGVDDPAPANNYTQRSITLP
jgi:uncharacterized repeat protein (TIGR01451 family)